MIKYPGQTAGRVDAEHRVTAGQFYRLLRAYADGQPLAPDNDLLNMDLPAAP